MNTGGDGEKVTWRQVEWRRQCLVLQGSHACRSSGGGAKSMKMPCVRWHVKERAYSKPQHHHAMSMLLLSQPCPVKVELITDIHGVKLKGMSVWPHEMLQSSTCPAM